MGKENSLLTVHHYVSEMPRKIRGITIYLGGSCGDGGGDGVNAGCVADRWCGVDSNVGFDSECVCVYVMAQCLYPRRNSLYVSGYIIYSYTLCL